MTTAQLPAGDAPEPVASSHFPNRVHAFVWRNWQLVPLERLAGVVGATPEQLLELGRSMGLSSPPPVTADQQRRSYLTVIRRNWHLLPYGQLLALLGWTAEELDFTLREDDFLFIKLGRHKPHCEPLRYAPPDEAARGRCGEIHAIVRESFGAAPDAIEEPLFSFVEDLRAVPETAAITPGNGSVFSPRYCYSYFALYGDPLLDAEADPYPDGYLARLAASGVDGVWLQAVLYKLARFPWDPSLSHGFEERLTNLRRLVERAAGHGIGIWLYLNEPRLMPLSFFEERPDLKGVTAGDHASLCTSNPEVRAFIVEAVESICRAAPDLAGFFTITASENRTHCWSHHRGDECPRCGPRGAPEVIAEVNTAVRQGIDRSGGTADLLVWDWGWRDEDAAGIIERLPDSVALMSVSEWNLPIKRGGVESIVGEYSLSAIGPGPRAKRHWALARKRGLRTIAKIQAANTWELSAAPYLPVLENLARNIANLREEGVDGLMLGWTLGGYPSPNLEVVAEMGRAAVPSPTPVEALRTVASRRYGDSAAPAVVRAWQAFSEAFQQFPYHIGTVYTAPQQFGPANPLWGEPTGYRATMIGFPYDDLDTWRTVYPAEVFVQQLERVATGFETALAVLRESVHEPSADLRREMGVAETAAIHFQAVANQARFVHARDRLAEAESAEAAAPLMDELQAALQSEIELARRLHRLQGADSRLGFEASNHYYYVPLDLVEKVVNCRDLLDRWLPEQRRSAFTPAR